MTVIGPITKQEFKYLGELRKDIQFMKGYTKTDFSKGIAKGSAIYADRLRSFKTPTEERAA